MAPKNHPRLPKTRGYHWYAVLLFMLGTLFPPLAVAARFGIGKDFWLNLLLTITGYIPGKSCVVAVCCCCFIVVLVGHAHNFYIQNIRNNKSHARTPKWALRYGLVDGSTIRRHERRSQWASKYKDRNPDSGYDQQPLEDGQVGPSRPSTVDDTANNGDGLWRPDDEAYYSAVRDGSLQTPESGGRWRYPANFSDSLPDVTTTTKKKKKDRWARTEDAYTATGQKKKKKKSKRRSTVGDAADVDSTHSHRTESTAELEVPEDVTRRVYGGREEGNGQATASHESEFNHQF